jgi:hypothetical protein
VHAAERVGWVGGWAGERGRVRSSRQCGVTGCVLAPPPHHHHTHTRPRPPPPDHQARHQRAHCRPAFG